MADIVNDRDVLIMATVPRFTPPTDRGMFLTPSTALFKVSSGGIGAPASITFQAQLLNMDGTVTWSWTDGMAPTVNGKELTLTYANFSAVTGTITAQVTVDGVLYTQVANVSKVVDGSSSSVQLLEVSTTSQIFKVSKSGANDPASITITATAQNLTGTPSFTIPYGTATLTAGPSSNQKILTFANMATDSVTVKVSLGGLEDNVTIIKVREGADGSDGLAALLTNESHALPASNDGVISSVSGAVTTMKVYKGIVDDSDNWTYSFTPGSSASTLSYTTSGGTLAVTGMNAGVDTASVDITASKAGASSITKRFTVTKSKTGASGTGQQGQRGNVDISAVTNSSVWSDAEAVAALAAAGYGAPQVRDLVNLYKADRTFGMQKMFNGSAWVTVDYVYNGNVFVKGSILPESIDTRGLTIRDAQGNIILGAGVGLPAAYAAPGTLNSDLNPAISSAAQTALWTGVSGRPNTYRVIARGGSGTGNDLPEGMYINGVARAYSASRSYNLIVIRRSDCAVVHALNYDVYGMGETAQGRTAYHLAEKLNSLSSDVIVVIYSADEPQLHRMEYGLPDAMYRCGASPAIFGSPQFKSRSAYILVGIPGVGTGGGAEAYQGDVDNDTGAWCDVGFNINSLGNIEMGQGVYKPTSLRDYSYVGDYDATKGATIGTNLYGQMNASNISTYIAGAAIDLALINKASITNLAALSAVIGLLRSATTGQRYELSDQGYQWFNAQNVAVIQIGNF